MKTEKIVKSIMNKLEKIDLLDAWESSKELLDNMKEIELKLRNKVIAENFRISTFGSNSVEVGGKKLTYTRSLSYKVNEDELNTEAIANMESNLINLNDLFRITHGLNLNLYKKLDSDQQNIVNEVLTIRENAPKLTIKDID